jgi:LmbE family N-acetylglucosaminyl deacetylase
LPLTVAVRPQPAARQLFAATFNGHPVANISTPVIAGRDTSTAPVQLQGESRGCSELKIETLPTGRFGTRIQRQLRNFAAALGFGVAKITISVAGSPLMIVAPHPDDETLMAGGIIAKSRAAGEPVKVVIVTNGDDKKGRPEYGLTREAESVAALQLLGLEPNDIIFLGYAGATGELLYLMNSYCSDDRTYTAKSGASSTYAAQGLGEQDFHSWLTGRPARYNGKNLLDDLETILKTFRPPHLYTSSRFDEHPEHRAVYYFVVRAIQAVRLQDPSYAPVLHTTVVHDVTSNSYDDFWDAARPLPQISVDFSGDDVWPAPNANTDRASTDTLPAFSPPHNLWRTTLDWSQVERFPVPAEMRTTDLETNLKYRALQQYTSQPLRYLAPFCKQDEIFWREELPATELLAIAPLMLTLKEGEASLIAISLVRPAQRMIAIAVETSDEAVLALPAAVVIQSGASTVTFPIKAINPGETVITAKLDGSHVIATVIVVESQDAASQGRPVFLS